MNDLSFANDILPVMNSDGANKKFEDSTVKDDFIISGEHYKCNWLIFDKITFLSKIFVSDASIGIGLKFINCVFNAELVFTNINAQGSDEVFDKAGRSLTFIQCKFESVFTITGDNAPLSINGKMQFLECAFKKRATLKNISIKDSGLSIGYCIFNDSVDFDKISTKHDVIIELSEFNGHTSFRDIEGSSLIFYKCNTTEQLHISGGNFAFRLEFRGGEYKNEVSINHLKSFDGLIFKNVIFKEAISVGFYSFNDREWTKSHPSQSKLKEVFIKNTEFQNGFSFYGLAEHTFVQKILLVFTTKLQGDISFTKLNIGLLRLSGSNVKSNLILTDVEVSTLKMENFNNHASIVFTRFRAFDSSKDGYIGDVLKMLQTFLPLTTDSEEHIENYEEVINVKSLFLAFQSNLGKTYFNQVDFSTFQIVVLREVNLGEITASNTRWFHPDTLEINHNFLGPAKNRTFNDSLEDERINVYALFQNSKDLPEIDVYAAKRDIYRQLKSAMQKQNDFPLSLEFQKHEMFFYNKILLNQNSKNWNELLIIWSNQSNDFGQNWIKATKLFFVFSFFIFIPIGFLNSHKLNFTTFADSWQDAFLNLQVIFVDNLKYWLVLMNPAHSLKDINPDPSILSGWIYFWDFLSRIVVSYFLFQIVSAFRKFNK